MLVNPCTIKLDSIEMKHQKKKRVSVVMKELVLSCVNQEWKKYVTIILNEFLPKSSLMAK